MATAPVRAAQTLTVTGNAVAAETVVCGGVTYTWRAAVGSTANEVLIGSTAAISLQNLKAAINLEAGAGTLYGSATVVNPQVGVTTVSATTLVIKAKVPGTAGNALATTETMTLGNWGAGTMAGGGGGTISDWIDDVLATSQVNADVYTDLAYLRGSSPPGWP